MVVGSPVVPIKQEQAELSLAGEAEQAERYAGIVGASLNWAVAVVEIVVSTVSIST
jgi:hypothetical protein